MEQEDRQGKFGKVKEREVHIFLFMYWVINRPNVGLCETPPPQGS